MHLKFGIPTLDELLEIPVPWVAPKNEIKLKADTASLALLGPDGSGKSVLALHLASNFRALCLSQVKKGDPLPLVVYVSSDLQYESANTVWTNFGLDHPGVRRIPFERMPSEVTRREQDRIVVDLQQLIPGGTGKHSEVGFLRNPQVGSGNLSSVGFLDLARHTAGDDWNFVNSLIVNLEAVDRPEINGEKLSHLVIIDSVAGFETFVGKLDAFGMEQSRRARIAQCMRNAGTHAHLVFVVEEPDEGKRLPEEYVTDVVLRLRSRREGGRSLRTAEVEKARARNHAVGEHTFEIRSERGSSTGQWENPDTPISQNAYVHVFHSLSHRNLLVTSDRGRGKPENAEEERSVKSFGLHYLDRLLERGRTGEGQASRSTAWGVQKGYTTAIIGDASTGKSLLAEKFIAEGFRQLVKDALAIYSLLKRKTISDPNREALQGALSRTCALLQQPVLRTKDSDKLQSEAVSANLRDFAQDILILAWKNGDRASEDALDLIFKQHFPKSKSHLLKRKAALRARKLPPPDDTEKKNGTYSRSRSECFAGIDDFEKALAEQNTGDALLKLFRHPNLRVPGILLTTGDQNVSILAERCLGYLRESIEQSLHDFFGEDRDMDADALGALKSILEEQLIVRRFDIDSMTAAALFDTVQRNTIEAQYLVHGEYFPPVKLLRYANAERIRIVIDDLRVLSNLCPSVSAESAFLPFLVFYLEREGVTSLFVHTDGLRPGVRPDDPISQELLSLLKQVILTWSVPFEGQSRVAISAIPATTRETNGIVREVELGRVRDIGRLAGVIKSELPQVDVTPKFELYADLEVGRPKLVPLAIYLFSATNACRKYMDEEDRLYREQFRPVQGIRDGESGRVIWPINATQYYAIRDLTHLPWDVHADHTIIDQVDGFWSLDAGTGALAPQNEYLMPEYPGTHEDPFGLFRGKPLHLDPRDKPPYKRKDYFQNSGYRSRITDFKPDPHQLMPDRVPFMWDFAFITVPVGPWEQARTKVVKFLQPGIDPPKWYLVGKTVGQMPKVEEILHGLQDPKHERHIIQWRLFFGACREVADQARLERSHTPVTFDFASTSAETFTSLILEIWFSEITLALHDKSSSRKGKWEKWLARLSSNVYESLPSDQLKHFSLTRLLGIGVKDKFKKFREDYCREAEEWHRSKTAGIAHHEGASKSEEDIVTAWEAATSVPGDPAIAVREKLFEDVLPVEALCLFKAWLLLLDVLDFGPVLDPDSPFAIRQQKDASGQAMAVRHYYRTACDHQSRIATNSTLISDSEYALAMPGIFSVRGDSFLASPQASRSRLLATHALDLLCSRRANLTRMQMGIGLPVRDVLKRDACSTMRTALRVMTQEPSLPLAKNGAQSKRDANVLSEISYGDFCSLGAETDHPDKVPEETSLWRSRWLFRNGIPEYDRVSRAMQKWLTRLCRWTISYRARHPFGWDGGLRAYDALSVNCFAPLLKYDSFLYFGELCDYLVAELEAAERKPKEVQASQPRESPPPLWKGTTSA